MNVYTKCGRVFKPNEILKIREDMQKGESFELL